MVYRVRLFTYYDPFFLLLFFRERSVHHTGKNALDERKACTQTPCSLLSVVGIYSNPP